MSYMLADNYYLIEPKDKKEEIKGVTLPDDDETDELSTGTIIAIGSDTTDEPYFKEGKEVVYSKKHKDSPVESITLNDIKYDVVPAVAIRLVIVETK